MSNHIITPEKLDVSKLTFSKVLKDETYNRKMVFVNRKDGELSTKVLIATPKVWLPKGMSRIRKKDATDSKEDSYVVDIGLKEDDVLYEKLTQMDDFVRKGIKENCKEWLGKDKVSDDVVEDRYKAMVNVYAPEGKDKVYNSIQLKVERERENNEFTGRFLGNKTQKIPLKFFDGTHPDHPEIEVNETNFASVVSKGAEARCLMELVYVSITSKVSVKWRLVQMEIHSRKQQVVTDYAFGGSDENEQMPVENDDEPDMAEEVESEVEEEEEVESEVEEEPEPVVVKVQPPKKPVTKKRSATPK